MKRTLCIQSLISALLIIFVGTAYAAETDIVNVSSSGNALNISTNFDTVGAVPMMLRIQGPDGVLVLRAESDYGTFDWQVGDVQDGYYRWEAIVLDNEKASYDTLPGEARQERAVLRESGFFEVAGGMVILPRGPHESESETLSQSDGVSGVLTRMAGAILDLIAPPAQAMTVTNPSVIYFDVTSWGDTRDWAFYTSSTLYICDETGSVHSHPLRVLASDNNNESLVVDAAGDLGLADETVFIDRSMNRVGIGTTTPADELHIAAGSPAITMEDTSDSSKWKINADQSHFYFENITDSDIPFVIQRGAPDWTMWLASSGKVGFGTQNPEAAIHLVHPTQDVIGLFESGDKFAGFELRDSDTKNFNVVVLARRNDMILRAGKQDRLWIDSTGNIGVGVANPTRPIQTFTGAYLSTGGSWVNSSSRDVKQNIEPLTSEDALEAFSQLQPVSFEYIAEPGEAQLGFIAEDVPDVVATQDRQGLSPMDMVALLTKVVQDQDNEIDDLTARLEALEQRQVQ